MKDTLRFACRSFGCAGIAMFLLATTTASAATILPKTTLVTASHALFGADLATEIYDGSVTNEAHPAVSAQAGFFFEINFGGTNVAGKGIEQLNIVNRDDCCPDRITNYRVEILDHTKATVFSTDVRTGGTNSGFGGTDTVDVLNLNGSAVIGQYVKLSRLTPTNAFALQIAEVDAFAAPANGATVALQNATAVRSQNNLSVDNAIDGLLGSGFNTGWGNDALGANTAAFETVEDLPAGILTFTLDARSFGDHNIGRFRISATTDDRSTFADGLDNGGDVTANWIELAPSTAVSQNGDALNILGDNSVLLNHLTSTNQSDVYTITTRAHFSGITGFRLEALADSSLPSNGPGTSNSNGNFVLTEFTVNLTTTAPEPSTFILTALGLLGLGFTRRQTYRRM